MGTRGAVIFAKGDKIHCMHNHFDSYPEGLGDELLTALKEAKTENLKGAYDRITSFTSNDIMEAIYKDITKAMYDNLNTLEKNRAYDRTVEKYRLSDSPDSIIKRLGDGEEVCIFGNDSFPADSLFCEYGYVIDTQTMMFEVYVGFNKKPVVGERFEYLNEMAEERGNGYYPIRKAGEWPLDKLPELDEVIEKVKEVKMQMSEESENKLYKNYPMTVEKYLGDELLETKTFDRPSGLRSYLKDVTAWAILQEKPVLVRQKVKEGNDICLLYVNMKLE